MKTLTVSNAEFDLIKRALFDMRMLVIDQSGMNPLNRDGRIMPINVLMQKLEKSSPN